MDHSASPRSRIPILTEMAAPSPRPVLKRSRRNSVIVASGLMSSRHRHRHRHRLRSAVFPEGMKRSSSQRPPSRVRVVWDEENLHQLEATKSPKQKITEPKTPYYAPDDGGLSPTPDDERLQMDSASHAEAVRHALSEVATDDRASSSRSSGSGSSWHYSEDELDGMEVDGGSELSHSGSFEEHRRKHYDNEYKKAKILLATDPALEEDADATANGEAGESSSAAAAGIAK